jgi:TonB family protein
MALREKFGRLVLLEQTDSDPLGDEYRAARLGAAGFDRLVSVLRFSPAVSAHAEASKRLVDEARTASQVHNPSLVRVLGVGRVNQSFYVSTELPEGRTVRTVLSHCAEEGFPFAVDHALMIASRAAAGLEFLHGRKDENGRPLVHGLLTPGRLVVAFDGEVKVKGLGLWPALGATDLLKPEERAYLAPEQAAGQAEPRSDVYALGLVLLEALLGQPPDGSDPLLHVAAARIASPGGDPAPLPKPLSALLRRSLGREPAARFGSIAEMRKAIDAMLFSGDFTPTTFDLAFFMHTLFRDEVEREAKAIEEARTADYREFLSEETAKPAAGNPQTEPADVRPPAPAAVLASAPTASLPPTVSLPPTAPESSHPATAAAAPPARASAPGPDSSGARHARVVRDSGAHEAAVRDASPRSARQPREGLSRNAWIAIGVAAALLLGGGGVGLFFMAQRRAAAAAAASAEQAAAQSRVRELETRIAQLEHEKQEAEAKAAEDARLALEKQAAAGGKSADPAAVARAQEEARQRARAEQERRQQEELARLSEAKRLEEQRVAAARAALATPPPTPLPLPTPVQATPTPAAVDPASSPQQASPNPSPTVESIQLPLSTAASPSPPGGGATPGPSAGQTGGRQAVADPSDPAVRPPTLVSEAQIPYPARAISRRLSAAVVVRAMVDETGKVSEATVIQASGQPLDYGFEHAALARVRGRKYRPARRNDVPVPIWVVVRVEFRPPPAR